MSGDFPNIEKKAEESKDDVVRLQVYSIPSFVQNFISMAFLQFLEIDIVVTRRLYDMGKKDVELTIMQRTEKDIARLHLLELDGVTAGWIHSFHADQSKGYSIMVKAVVVRGGSAILFHHEVFAGRWSVSVSPAGEIQTLLACDPEEFVPKSARTIPDGQPVIDIIGSYIFDAQPFDIEGLVSTSS